MLFQAFTSIFSSSKTETPVESTVRDVIPQQSEGNTKAIIPDAQIIFNEREARRDLKDRFYTVEGGISTKTLAILVDQLQESKEREEDAANRIRAKAAIRTQAKETKRQQLRSNMEAKKQPHLNAIARINDKMFQAGF